MNRRTVLGLTTTALLCTGIAFSATNAVAQQKSLKEQLVGTWIFVSSTGQRPDGSSNWGSNPKGLLVLTADGRYSSQIMRGDIPKYASNNRLKATPQEHKATVEGVISSLGTYTVDEATKTITQHIESSSFPNWSGTSQKRTIITLTADELKYGNPAPSTGGPASELVWRRAK